MDYKITKLRAIEILDSRKKPTIEVELFFGDERCKASVPSGASTGKNEAVELRDEDGGVRMVIDNINNIIAPNLLGKIPTNQKEIDDFLISLDATKNKSKLGANAILAVSIAVCRAGAKTLNLPLYKHIANLAGNSLKPILPLPMLNIINGGAHVVSDIKLDIQEFMIVPQAGTLEENIKLAKEITDTLRNNLLHDFGSSLLMGDEGGFAPPLRKTKEALYFLREAIGKNKAKIALDCAASEFYKDGLYFFEGKNLKSLELLKFYKELVKEFNIISLEDPYSENDVKGFTVVSEELPDLIVVGDDLTTTNIKSMEKAQEKKACNGMIIKPNQIGSVSEAIEAANIAKSYRWKTIASHRSGETMDDFIADFAVGVGTDFIKSGAYTQKERMVKYDRLLEIEKEIKYISS